MYIYIYIYIYIARSNIELSKNEPLRSEFKPHIFKISWKLIFKNISHETISCKKDTETKFHLHDKIPYKKLHPFSLLSEPV